MHYEETMQLIEAYKNNPVEGTIILISVVALIIYLVYIDRKRQQNQKKY